ncbi:hypothetical protein GOARA_070_00030 [Gordonia araii NBRC 100433]|uniref:Uncharacterized protein n=1 Tax=Gordonia araii NBRC 100433 TaxID=1073574 RepID=G7H6I9_9ACTN|nr:hypothetical protein [Gordonia araii]NNG99277.1 hypothetical protein [Gordonia araii NBRC 100433]GAB11464.1 hypothetical protein GOARA_070_00030 [Gordonia araii NBRC 100433]
MEAERFPIDSRSLWYSGQYRRVGDGWYQYRKLRDQFVVYSSNLEPLPPGFMPWPESTTADARVYGGFKHADDDDVGATVAVGTVCVWKNLAWEVFGSSPSTGIWTLYLASAPDSYPMSGPYPSVVERKDWPGVSALSRDDVVVDVVPGEVALIRVNVVPIDSVARRGVALEERAVWWRESLRYSPWLPASEASEIAGRHTGVPANGLAALRVRDGWQVVAAEEDAGRGVGTPGLFVADDATVMAAAADESDDDASRRLTDELIARLQNGPKIAAIGPVGHDFMPTVLDPQA